MLAHRTQGRLVFGAWDGYSSPMPIYEFHCDQCERDSEILVRSSRWKGSKCPHCGSTNLSKKLSVFASAVASTGGRSAPPCEGGQGSCGSCCGGGKHRH
jgi:putative FmdB family regulatory protein